MNTQSPTAVRVYLARVRSALTDLPPAEVEEILEDVRPHLTEIAGELGADTRVEALIEQLGTPEAYAAELRAAGDYPPATMSPTAPAKKSRFVARLAVWGLLISLLGLGITGFGVASTMRAHSMVAFVVLVPVVVLSAWYVFHGGAGPVADLPEVRKARSALSTLATGDGHKVFTYLRSLQPAWWLSCAVLLVLLGLLVFLTRGQNLLALPPFIAAAAAIVWFGPKSKTDRRLLWLSLPISAFVVGGTLGLVSYRVDRLINQYNYDGSSASSYNQTADGKPDLYYGQNNVGNVYVFDAQGKPLTDVFLYDETGRPLTLPRYACEARSGNQLKIGEDNRYPRPHLVQGAVDDYGVYNGYNAGRAACREETGVPFSAAIPKGMQPSVPSSATATPPSSSSAVPDSSTKPTS